MNQSIFLFLFNVTLTLSMQLPERSVSNDGTSTINIKKIPGSTEDSPALQTHLVVGGIWGIIQLISSGKEIVQLISEAQTLPNL